MKIGDVFLALGFDVDDKKLKSFDGQMVNLKSNLFGVKEYALAAVYALTQFVSSSTQGATSLDNFNEQTGLSIQLLQEWQNAAHQSNTALSFDQVTAGITNLQKQLTALRLGKGDFAPFAMLGIDTVGRDAFQVLDQLREKIRSGAVDKSLASSFLDQMGLGAGFINVLEKSKSEFDELNKNVKFASPEQLERNVEAARSIARLGTAFGNLKDRIVSDLAPAFDIVADYMDRIGPKIDLFVGKFHKFTEEVYKGGGPLGYLGTSLEELAKSYGKLLSNQDGASGSLMALAKGAEFASKYLALTLKTLDELAAWTMTGKLSPNLTRLLQFFTPGDKNNFTNLLKDANEMLFQPDARAPLPVAPSQTGNDDSKKSTVFNNNVIVNTQTTDPYEHGRITADTIEKASRQINNGTRF